jgi:hypothetical protein
MAESGFKNGLLNKVNCGKWNKKVPLYFKE